MPKTTANDSVDAYIAAQPESAHRVLRRVRTLIRQVIPDVTEGISYQIPVFKKDGHMVCFFAGHREHYAIYPITPFVVDALRGTIDRYMHGKATVRFAYDDTMPTHLIQRIVNLRAQETAEGSRSGPPKRTSSTKKPPAKKATAKKATTKKATAKKATAKKATAKKATAKKATAKKKK
jgi:uncharacterized protein YdhG (YjbR/CyaY superfamily)